MGWQHLLPSHRPFCQDVQTRSMASQRFQGRPERLAGGYGPESERIRQDLAIAESQLRDYQARLGAPFVQDG